MADEISYMEGYDKGYGDGYAQACVNIRRNLMKWISILPDEVSRSVIQAAISEVRQRMPDNTDYRTSDDPRKERDDMASQHPQLRRELEDTLRRINLQIDAVEIIAKNLGVPVEKVEFKDGHKMMTELLVAKASTLNALASL